jgi:DedD protein
MADTDVQLHIKKRARRRLVGAIAFVSVVAVVLPMVMDNQPRQHVQEVEIRIPGQDEKSFAPKFAAAPVEKAPEVVVVKPVATSPPIETKPSPPPIAKVIEAPREKTVEKASDKPVVKPQEKPAEKAQEKIVKTEKTAEKPVEKPVQKDVDAKRAAAILAGHGDAPASKSGEYLVLIGAFSNEANVKIIKEKLAQQGVKTFSEPLDTPQGKKTRVRAGPFASREAAEKALVKMQSIGVSGVVSAK